MATMAAGHPPVTPLGNCHLILGDRDNQLVGDDFSNIVSPERMALARGI
jgi:hypothetical protein